MILANLFGRQPQRYFEHLPSRTALWLFVHVPKTAGSSLNAELVPILHPNYHIFVDYTQVEHRPFHELLDEAVARFLAAAAIRRYAYCTGHMTADHVTRITEALPYARPITLLRDPVARFISDYRYQCSPMHPGHEAFRAKYKTIDAYLDLPWESNKATAHLVPDPLRRLGAPGPCVDYLMDHYAFIGIQEMYALSLRVITTLAGTPRRPKAYKRISARAEAEEPGVTPAQERRIRDLNALDIAIYEDIAARFRTISAAVEAYLDQAHPLIPELA
jgi:hypothetical protein